MTVYWTAVLLTAYPTGARHSASASSRWSAFARMSGIDDAIATLLLSRAFFKPMCPLGGEFLCQEP